MNRHLIHEAHDGLVCISSRTPEQFISSPQDFLDLLALGGENETDCFVLEESNFAPAFYDLKTGLAGEILQKLSNYNCRLAVVGTFAGVKSKRFRELMSELNGGRLVRFAADRNEAIAWLKELRAVKSDSD